MRLRTLQSVAGITIILMSMLTPLWADLATNGLSRSGRSVVALRDVRFQGTALADNEDNSDDDNDDDDDDNDDDDDDDDDDNDDDSDDNDNDDDGDNDDEDEDGDNDD